MGTQRFRALVEHSPDLILILSPEGIIDYAGPSVASFLGVFDRSLTGHRLEDLVHPEDLSAAQQLVASAQGESRTRGREVLRMQAADGRWIHVDSIASNCVDEPDVRGILIHGRDVTERVALEQKLSFEALHDALTGLANRALFKDRVGQALSSPGAQPGSVAVIMLDLDRFKSVNDTLGHEAGDELLMAVATRLLSATRGSDTVGRLGGDEFAVLLSGLRGREDVLPVLNRIEASLQRPVTVREREIIASGSIGVSIATAGVDVTELMRQADVAMYAAKVSDRTTTSRFFAPEMQAAAHQRAQLEADLRQALDSDGLWVAYQPLLELTSGRVYGVEALVRWQHPERGAIGPDRFIPLAEETGLIGDLGRWVLHHACRTVAEWQKAAPRVPPILLSVNLSARQLVDPQVVSDVADALSTSGLAPGTLVLELTESALVEDTAIVMQRLSDLRSLGVKLAIDDFGTGYSSLAYLRSFPVEILKIDRRFISDLDTGDRSSALAKAVLGLGATLSLRMVAEGIERESQLAELRAMGCHYGQGFLLARPLRAAEAQRFVQERQR